MQIARRELLAGIAGLPLAMILADPRLAFAAAHRWRAQGFRGARRAERDPGAGGDAGA